MSEPIRILSTRPLEDPLCLQAKEAGISLDILSFIETRRVTNEELGDRIRSLALSPLLAVFTSMNAVSAVADWLRSPLIVPWDIYSIGAATAKLVGTSFGKERIVGTAESASALADRILTDTIGKGQVKEVFFFCGDLRRDELPEKLRRASINVNELIVYETLPIHHKVEIDYDGIVFFSPSAVHSFFATNTVRAATVIFAIGQTTAEAIRGHCDNEPVISKTPDKENLIRQVIDHY